MIMRLTMRTMPGESPSSSCTGGVWPDAIVRIAASGVQRIAIVPIFLGQGGHLKRDLPILLEQVRAAHPECEITLAAAVGESASVIAAMADYASGCAV